MEPPVDCYILCLEVRVEHEILIVRLICDLAAPKWQVSVIVLPTPQRFVNLTTADTATRLIATFCCSACFPHHRLPNMGSHHKRAQPSPTQLAPMSRQASYLPLLPLLI